MGEFEFKGKKIDPKSPKWVAYMEMLEERKKAIETNDELLLNKTVEKSLFEVSGLTREDIKDWTVDEIYECIAKIRDASTPPLQPSKE